MDIFGTQLSKDNKIVDETINLFDIFSRSNRQRWITEVREDSDFRLGNQWSEQQIAEFVAKGQIPVVINRVHPAIEQTKAMLTSRNPSFRVSPREDSDNQVAQALNGLLQYVWQISNGDMEHADIVDNLCTKGIGYWYTYIDPQADMGKGEVKICGLPVEDVYVDPNSRDRFFKDASDIIISRKYTKGQLNRIYPEYKKAISNATGIFTDDFISSKNSDLKGVFYADSEDINRTDEFGEYVRLYERYTKEFVKRMRVYEDFSGREDTLTNEEFEEYIKLPSWSVNGQIYSNEQKAFEVAQASLDAYNSMLANIKQAEVALQQGLITDEQYAELANSLPQPPEIRNHSFYELIQAGIIKVVEITTQRIKMIVVAGDKLLYQRVLTTEDYPVIPLCNIHTGSPYPIGDVRIVKDKQRALNKIRSLILTHASASTNVKLLMPRGSVDIATIEKQWAKPNAVIEFEPSEGAPVPVLPLQMSNELFTSEQTLKNDIDHEFGIYEAMMGNGQQAPSTYRATIALDEFGQRKLKNKMQIIETSLVMLGKIVLAYCQELYSTEKIVRLLQPNNSMTEYAINKKLYDDYGNVIDIVNDISRVKYDVIVVSGSTLPSNRYAQLDFYMEAYKMGIIDRQEVLKKTEVFDYEGVMQRTDEIQQLKSALEQAQEEIKKLSGDLQTAQRETTHANQRTINAQYESKLKGNELENQKQTELYTARAGDSLRNLTERVSIELEKEKLKSSKESANKQKNKKNK